MMTKHEKLENFDEVCLRLTRATCGREFCFRGSSLQVPMSEEDDGSFAASDREFLSS
jgi:hypothetical protein